MLISRYGFGPPPFRMISNTSIFAYSARLSRLRCHLMTFPSFALSYGHLDIWTPKTGVFEICTPSRVPEISTPIDYSQLCLMAKRVAASGSLAGRPRAGIEPMEPQTIRIPCGRHKNPDVRQMGPKTSLYKYSTLPTQESPFAVTSTPL